MNKVKPFILLCALIIFIIVASCRAHAETFIPVESITPLSDSCRNLVDTMLAQSDYDSFKDWVSFYTAPGDLSLFYNIQDGEAVRLRLYDVDGSPTFEKSHVYDFGYQQNGYTYIGNVSGSLGSAAATEGHKSDISTLSIVSLVILVAFFVFRSRKKSKSYMSL